MGETRKIALTVNGKRYEEEVEVRWTLADFLRHQLGLTGTHLGCEHGVCGACTILLDGRSARSCLMLAVQAERPRDAHRRGHRALARQAASAAAGVPRASRPAVRLLHARHADHAARIPARQSGPDRAGGADRDLRQSVPLHRLPEHRDRDARCRQAAARTERNERHRHAWAPSLVGSGRGGAFGTMSEPRACHRFARPTSAKRWVPRAMSRHDDAQSLLDASWPFASTISATG